MRLHGSDTYFCALENRKLKWRNQLYEKLAYKKATGIIAVSDYTGNKSNQVFGLSRQYRVVPNGINLENFTPSTTSDPHTILYFGTLIRKKGLLELPLIFNKIHEKHPEAQLILVGKDAADVLTGHRSVWKMMQPLFTASALRQVHYVGAVPYEEMRQWIAKATVCVFPTFAEALPVSWLEAMAVQKPLVASNIGWASEIITHGIDGFLVHPTHHQEYADMVVQLLENPALAKTMAFEARTTIEKRFRIEKVAAQWVATYQELLQ
jgi:glycosyltransferase involved in cell wall biosynthesis